MAKNPLKYKDLYEGSQKLWKQMLEGQDSDSIIATAFGLIENPLVIFSHAVLFKTVGTDPEFSVKNLFPLGKEDTESNAENIFFYDEDMLRIDDPHVRHGILCTGICYKGEQLGRILVLGKNRTFHENDGVFLSTLAKILGHYFSADVFPQINSSAQELSLFHSLMNPDKSDPYVIAQRLKELEINPELGLQLVIIGQRDQSLLTAMANMRKYCNIMQSSIYALYQGNIVAINSKSKKSDYGISDFLVRELEKNKYACGISREYFDPVSTPTFYTQTMFCLRFREFMHLPEYLVYYEDCSAEHSICYASLHIDELHNMLDPRYAKLCLFDESGPKCLIDTLRVYIRHIKHPTEAAKILNIHRNTYFYRINKIEEMTGWDLGDGNDLHKIIFYLKITDMLEQQEKNNDPNLSYLLTDNYIPSSY